MFIKRIEEILEECSGKEGEPGVEVVDVWLTVPLCVEKVREYEQEMQQLLESWPTSGQSVPKLGEEMSYHDVRRAVFTNHTTFDLLAFGKLLGWWIVDTPATTSGLSKDDPIAQDMVRMGFVTIRGYTPAGVMP